MAKQDLITRAEFAKRCGVSGAAITKAVKRPPMTQIVVGKYVDAGHKEARKYLRSKNPDSDLRKNPQHVAGSASTKQKQAAANPSGIDLHAPPENLYKPIPPDDFIPDEEHDTGDIAQYLELSLAEILLRFGSSVKFNDWLKAVKEIESIRDKRLRNDEREHKYVPRDLSLQVFSRYERCFKLQLADSTRSLAAQIRDNADAGGTLEDAVALAEDLIGAPIADAKKNIAVLLKEYMENA